MNLEALARVLPPITDFNKPYWDGCRANELRLQTCNACGKRWFPEGPCCPECLSTDFAWKAVSGRGKVWSFIHMHQKYIAAYADEVPYMVAMIELEEGPRMYSTLVDPPADLKCGAPVSVVFATVGDRVIPKFKVMR